MDVYRWVKMTRPKINNCEKCKGEGWLWGYELETPSEDSLCDIMTQYSCDKCHAMCGYMAPSAGDEEL